LAHPWLNGEADTNPLVADVLVKLTNLSANNRLKAHLLDVLSSSDCLSNAELERLKKDFADMDLNGDGKISLDEIKVLQRKNPKLASSVQDLMMLTDTNGDQQLDFQEVLIAATQRKLVAKEERLRNLFEQLDLDHSGTISASELSNVLNLPLEQVRSMIQEVDTDGNGALSYTEFIEVFVKSQAFEGLALDG